MIFNCITFYLFSTCLHTTSDKQSYLPHKTWWRHHIETFSVLLAICAANLPVPDEFSIQRPVTQSFDVFFDLCLNKRLSKQSGGWWFEMPSCPLWRDCNEGCISYFALWKLWLNTICVNPCCLRHTHMPAPINDVCHILHHKNIFLFRLETFISFWRPN